MNYDNAKKYFKKFLNDNFDINDKKISHKIRTISTAKHFTKDKINIDEAFGERKFGINNWEELPSKFGERIL